MKSAIIILAVFGFASTAHAVDYKEARKQCDEIVMPVLNAEAESDKFWYDTIRFVSAGHTEKKGVFCNVQLQGKNSRGRWTSRPIKVTVAEIQQELLEKQGK